MQRSMNAILVSSAYIRIVEYRVLSARSYMCIEKKKPEYWLCESRGGTSNNRLQTSDFRLFRESEVRGLKNEVWSLKSKVLPRFRTISVGWSIYWYFFKPRYNLASKANILSLNVVNLPCQRLSLDPGPIFSYQDHIYFKAAMTDKIELGNDLIDCLIQVRLYSSLW